MSEIRALIVDDEPLARDVIRGLLACHEDVVVVGECRDGHDAVRAVRSLAPTLLFLDVQMPELDGFGVLRRLGVATPPAVIFSTAYDEFAVRAFDALALDYLVKPFADERFHVAVRRARRHLRLQETSHLTERLLALARGADVHGATAGVSRYRDRLLVTVAARTIVIPVETIDWVAADGYYARLHCGSHAHLMRRSLTELERELDPSAFLRTHRSAIVRIDRVRELRRSRTRGREIVLHSGERVPVSERRQEEVASRLSGVIRSD